MNKLIKLLIWPVFLAPLAYLAFTLQKLPQRIPVHFDFNGQPDRYGNKNELWLPVGIITVVSIGVYYLLTNLHRIDPKRSYTQETLGRMKRLALGLALFMSAIGFYMVKSATDGSINMSGNGLLVFMGLFFAFLGNYMYNIKPNYFAGFRLPWTLHDDENWRLTHKLVGVLWFTGGLLVTVLSMVLPPTAAKLSFFIIMGIASIIPVVYSYKLYAAKRKQKNNE